MRFVQILEDKRLWAVEYEGEGGNCFDLLFSNWYDMNWLKGFFKENLADLSSYFHITDVYEAVMETIDEAKRLECLMLDIDPEANLASGEHSFFGDGFGTGKGKRRRKVPASFLA